MSLFPDRTRRIQTTGAVAAVVFTVLFLTRLDLIQSLLSHPRPITPGAGAVVGARESWMAILQSDQRIGYTHTRITPQDGGFGLDEETVVRINTMGMIQDLTLRHHADLLPDLTLSRFEFEIGSGRFRFTARGAVSGSVIAIRTESLGSRQAFEVPFKRRPHPAAVIVAALASTRLRVGDRYAFDAFDPASLALLPVTAEIIDREPIEIQGSRVPATRVAVNFKGMVQTAWIGETGETLRERGLLGMRLERTTRVEALREIEAATVPDLGAAAAVDPGRSIADPQGRSELRLKLGGIGAGGGLQLQGGRQSFSGGVLTVHKETLEGLAQPGGLQPMGALEQVFLKAEPLIQADHEKIRALARSILGATPPAAPLEAVRLLLDWIDRNIEKRPVLSMPDALSTLENRMGDCNEHAMLFAALARAAGIPTRVEAGLVYLKGKFYYHAWNLVFLGRWVTVDATFGQLPADVTHLRLVTGSLNRQLDLAAVLGKITIEVLD
jgi:hypothetical protein